MPEQEKEQTTTSANTCAIKYDLADLKAASRKLFNCVPEVIDGAVYGKPTQQYTVDEVRVLVNTFLNKPIK